MDEPQPGRAGRRGTEVHRVVALAVGDDGAAVGVVDTGQDLDQRRLARPVLADQRVDGARQHGDADIVQRHRPRKVLRHAVHAQRGLRRRFERRRYLTCHADL